MFAKRHRLIPQPIQRWQEQATWEPIRKVLLWRSAASSAAIPASLTAILSKQTYKQNGSTLYFHDVSFWKKNRSKNTWHRRLQPLRLLPFLICFLQNTNLLALKYTVTLIFSRNYLFSSHRSLIPFPPPSPNLDNSLFHVLSSIPHLSRNLV